MKVHIPIYPLNNLTDKEGNELDVLILNQPVNTRQLPIDIPHRTNYYGIGMGIKGNAELKANLDSYNIEPGSLVLMSPQVIKQWTRMSDDFETLAILFTSKFVGETNLVKFPYFDNNARHIFHLAKTEEEEITVFLDLLNRKFGSENTYRMETVKALLQGLLFEIASVYEIYNNAVLAMQSRSQLLVTEFKILVNTHAIKERSLGFYAERMFITPGHLIDTVKEVTGHTPHEWIVEAVMLEAKILLQDFSLSISQIADNLCFSDGSAFGKFFKNLSGQSPLAYRQGLL